MDLVLAQIAHNLGLLGFLLKMHRIFHFAVCPGALRLQLFLCFIFIDKIYLQAQCQITH